MLEAATNQEKKMAGIGEVIFGFADNSLLIAPNLGSCLAVAAYDPGLRIGGVIHCLLPLSQVDLEKAKRQPCLYVDSGVSFLLDALFKKGADKARLKIAAAGAGNINDERNVFEIGKKNHTIFRKVLWKNGLLIAGEHVGTSTSVTLMLSLVDGQAIAKSKEGEFSLF